MPNHFVEHLLDTVAVIVQLSSENSPVHCRFLQCALSISPVSLWRLAPRPLPLVPAPHERLEGYGRRRRAGGGAPPVSDGSGGFAAARERRSADGAAQATGGRRVATHSPVHAAIRRRELLGAECALCRRRAHTAAPSRTGALCQARPRFSGGTAPVNLPDAA